MSAIDPGCRPIQGGVPMFLSSVKLPRVSTGLGAVVWARLVAGQRVLAGFVFSCYAATGRGGISRKNSLFFSIA